MALLAMGSMYGGALMQPVGEIFVSVKIVTLGNFKLQQCLYAKLIRYHL